MLTINFTPATATDRQILTAITRVARIQEATPSFEQVRHAREDIGTLAIYANRLNIPAAAQHAAVREGKRQAQEAMAR